VLASLAFVLPFAGGMAKPITELTFRRASISLSDAARLDVGEDLNDATLDFFIKLGQELIPKDGKPPVSYLGALFWKQLISAFATSGEMGWKNVAGWAKRKAGGLFAPTYGAFAVPINEDLKDDKGQDAGNHWWLALILNPPGGAMRETTAVMCLDSMQRREKMYAPPITVYLSGSVNKYSLDITKVEQAGYLIIISFTATGDGSRGPLQRPESSRLRVGGRELRNPQLGLRINMQGSEGVRGTFEGTLTFELDGRIRSSVFELMYGAEGYAPIKLQFDPFELTKLQKTVSRFVGGYLSKEWEENGPSKKVKFDKTSAQALVADVCQQENLNDCGVFVLENILRSLSMQTDFLKKMGSATPEVLKTFPWPTQSEISARKAKLKAITGRLFQAAASKGTGDIEAVMKGDALLRQEAKTALTEDRESGELDQWSVNLTQEIAARQVDKTAEDEARKDKQLEKEEAFQKKKADEGARRQEEEEEKEREYQARLKVIRAEEDERERSRKRRKKLEKQRREKEKDNKRKSKRSSASNDSRPRSRSRSNSEKRRVKELFASRSRSRSRRRRTGESTGWARESLQALCWTS